MLDATRFLIALPATLLREAAYLHVFEDGALEFAADPRRALRFATKHDAERFGQDRLLTVFLVEPWHAADLAPLEPDDEDEDGQIEDDFAGMKPDRHRFS